MTKGSHEIKSTATGTPPRPYCSLRQTFSKYCAQNAGHAKQPRFSPKTVDVRRGHINKSWVLQTFLGSSVTLCAGSAPRRLPQRVPATARFSILAYWPYENLLVRFSLAPNSICLGGNHSRVMEATPSIGRGARRGRHRAK